MLRESSELRDLLGGPLDPEQLELARTLALGTLATGSTAVDVALGVARDHAVEGERRARRRRRPRPRGVPHARDGSSKVSSSRES